ncbi:redoxin domain-containing protein [Halomicroarcula sp. F13]|uniref:Redoxin domain-containing protein n=1 Tax=Haloarcula rubra TaxID=2487747 RepID=A0AAW4PXR3_9EURY|nr:redoxin domain-containing protein [Halomicroarcula rubra]MBX0325123.1 redoxin domain-containing protein [Halomicroarcula rubra]
MIAEGQQAPQFELPAVIEKETTTLDLEVATSDGGAVLLLFYPFDFSPVCTTELCAIRDAEWFEFTPNLSVWAISGDSTYAHREFADEYDLTFPLLSDYHATTAEKFDIRYESWEDHECVPKRAVFLIDSDRTVQYSWAAEQAYTKPDFVPVKAALDRLSGLGVELETDEIDFTVEYSEE